MEKTFIPKKDENFCFPYIADEIARDFVDGCNVLLYGSQTENYKLVEQLAAYGNFPLVEVSDMFTTQELVGYHELQKGEIVWCEGAAIQAAREGMWLIVNIGADGMTKPAEILHALMQLTIPSLKEFRIKETGEVVPVHSKFRLILNFGVEPSTVINYALIDKFRVYNVGDEIWRAQKYQKQQAGTKTSEV